jgi:hypothetical protein
MGRIRRHPDRPVRRRPGYRGRRRVEAAFAAVARRRHRCVAVVLGGFTGDVRHPPSRCGTGRRRRLAGSRARGSPSPHRDECRDGDDGQRGDADWRALRHFAADAAQVRRHRRRRGDETAVALRRRRDECAGRNAHGCKVLNRELLCTLPAAGQMCQGRRQPRRASAAARDAVADGQEGVDKVGVERTTHRSDAAAADAQRNRRRELKAGVGRRFDDAAMAVDAAAA